MSVPERVHRIGLRGVVGAGIPHGDSPEVDFGRVVEDLLGQGGDVDAGVRLAGNEEVAGGQLGELGEQVLEGGPARGGGVLVRVAALFPARLRFAVAVPHPDRRLERHQVGDLGPAPRVVHEAAVGRHHERAVLLQEAVERRRAGPAYEKRQRETRIGSRELGSNEHTCTNRTVQPQHDGLGFGMGSLGEREPVVDLAEPVLGRVAALGGVQVPRKVRRLCLDGVIASVQSGQLHDEVFEGRRLNESRSKGGDEKSCSSNSNHGSPTSSSAR
jgi:hypothetical protein